MPQRSLLLVLLTTMLIWLIVRMTMNPLYVSEPQPSVAARADELQDRIDPNIADWATLAALPAIGEKRARDIVAYREKFAAANPGKLAFARPQDLLRVRGVGDRILSQIEPFLFFPEQASASRPADP